MSKKAQPQPPTSLDAFDRLTAQNRRLAEEVKRRVDQLSAINSVATLVGQSLDLEVTLQAALTAVMDVITVEATGISLIDDKTQELVLRAQRGWRRDFVKMGMRMPMGHGLSWHVIQNDELVVTGDVAKDPRIQYPAFQEEGIQAQALAPMHARGRVNGILSAMSYESYTFTPEELTVLAAIADQVGVALDNARLFSDVTSSESRLRAILDSTADAIIAVDMAREVTMFNATAETLFETNKSWVVGQPLEKCDLPEPLVRGLAEAAGREDRTPLTFDVSFDVGRGKRVLSCAISPVLDAADVPQGWVAVMADITHIRALEQLKTQAIQTAAHDLRNPLAAISGAVELLYGAFDAPTEKQEKLFKLSFEGIKQTQRLVENLLNIEQIEAGLVLDQRIDLSRVVKRAVAELRPAAESRGLTFDVEVPARLPELHGSEIWLERAVANYLSNAVKYAPRNGSIQVRAWSKRKEVILEVEDNGPGIPLEAQGRVFERFYRIPQQNEDGPVRGTGLGLAIVKLVVEQHGGRVYVRSQPGKGSAFGLALPVSG